VAELTDTKKLVELNINMDPVRIEFELTEQCNLLCAFCYNSRRPASSNIAIDILEKLSQENVLEIVLTGGEPLLHPEFHNIFARSSALFQKTMVQTNGTFINEQAVKFLKKYEIYSVNVSLHGLKNVHEKLTAIPGCYDLAISAIKHLLRYGIRTASNFVMTSQNISSFSETVDMLYAMGLREMTLTRFTPAGFGAKNRYLAVSIEDMISALYTAKGKMAMHPDFNIILANSIPYCSLPIDLSHFCSYCHFGGSRFYIDIHGNVMMCGMSRIIIGNILEMSFREIKNRSDEYKTHIAGTDVPGVCVKCDHFEVCRGGCRAASYAYTNNISGRDPYMLRSEG
jgi:radical SAM protein with 4Fe4S-binding SPASM domain